MKDNLPAFRGCLTTFPLMIKNIFSLHSNEIISSDFLLYLVHKNPPVFLCPCLLVSSGKR